MFEGCGEVRVDSYIVIMGFPWSARTRATVLEMVPLRALEVTVRGDRPNSNQVGFSFLMALFLEL